jgi:UDP-3-O-[3-hydroxymyristoyl] glucosamine N-acyltransferase
VSHLIAASAIIPASVAIGPFCVLGENVVLGEDVVLGVGCVLGDGCRVGAGSVLGNYVSVGTGAHIGARTRIGDHTMICPSVELGEDGFIGGNSSIGRLPKAAATSTVKAQADLPPLKMGNRFTVGCSAVLYAGTSYADEAFVGDGAVVRERCTIGQNVVIGSRVVVENDTKIGSFTKIQTGSYITAYMDIEERVFIAPMVTTTNDNFMGRTEKRFKFIKGPTIRRGARIGGGAILLPGVKVAPETFVAAGALITKDTTEKHVLKGLPAKDLREVPEEELLP